MNRKLAPPTDRMRAALVQVARYGTYEGFIKSCEALARRGLMRWEHGRALFHGYVLTPEGQRLADESLAKVARAVTIGSEPSSSQPSDKPV